jgi:hypothetical protein
VAIGADSRSMAVTVIRLGPDDVQESLHTRPKSGRM